MHYAGSSNVLDAICTTTRGLIKSNSIAAQLAERCKQSAQRPGRLPGLADNLTHLVLRLLQHQCINAHVRHLPGRWCAGQSQTPMPPGLCPCGGPAFPLCILLSLYLFCERKLAPVAPNDANSASIEARGLLSTEHRSVLKLAWQRQGSACERRMLPGTRRGGRPKLLGPAITMPRAASPGCGPSSRPPGRTYAQTCS